MLRPLAIFLYGVSVGMAIAWVIAVLAFDGTADVRWFAVGAAVALASGLIVHQRSNRDARGRRWRRTGR